jgi:hypothetical protein
LHFGTRRLWHPQPCKAMWPWHTAAEGRGTQHKSLQQPAWLVESVTTSTSARSILLSDVLFFFPLKKDKTVQFRS